MRPFTILRVLVTGGLLAGCSRPSPTPVLAGEAGADVVEAAVCAERSGCHVERTLDLGPGADGRARVAVIVRGSKPLAPRSGVRLAGPVAEDFWTPGTQEPSGVASSGCVPWETWLVSTSAGDARRVQLLTLDCMSPPVLEKLGSGDLRVTRGAREVDLDSGHDVYSEQVETVDFGLDPVRAIRIARRTGNQLAPFEHGLFQAGVSWDWAAFRGEACSLTEHACSPILPSAQIADDGAFAGGGWKTTALGECSLLVEEKPPSTASVRVLSGDTLYIEVTDDVFVTQGAAVDAIEVVSTFPEAKPGESAWADRLAMDGTLTDHDGKRRQVGVAEAGPSTRRFAVKGLWPPAERYWSIAYEDTDDGHTIRRIPALGPKGPGSQTVLSVTPTARCAPRDGVLHVAPAVAQGPETPVAP